jgi:hypothetical protein
MITVKRIKVLFKGTMYTKRPWGCVSLLWTDSNVRMPLQTAGVPYRTIPYHHTICTSWWRQGSKPRTTILCWGEKRRVKMSEILRDAI